jgi:teichuronic acid biosynthesis glycosyltransferase TuaG
VRERAAPPKVSVIVPAYSCGAYLRQAVTSALRQSVKDIEVLVIDDGSADDTLQVAQALAREDRRVRVAANGRNMGVARTRNRGIDDARGDYIAFLDGDDEWRRDKLEKQLAFMEQTRCDLSYTAYALMDEKGDVRGKPYHVPRRISVPRLLRENVVGCSSAVIRRAAVGDIRMRPGYAHEDYVFWLELLRNGRVAGGIDEALMRYRILPSARSAKKPKAAAGRWKIYRDFMGLSFPAALFLIAVYTWKGFRKHARFVFGRRAPAVPADARDFGV